jgi:hypothetical protein
VRLSCCGFVDMGTDKINEEEEEEEEDTEG